MKLSINRIAAYLRAKKSRSSLKPQPVISPCIQFIGYGDELTSAQAAVVGPVNDGGATGVAGEGSLGRQFYVITEDPSGALHGFKCSPEVSKFLRSVFGWLDHKRNPKYRNRFGLQVGTGGAK